jgi:hypothetical protein
VLFRNFLNRHEAYTVMDRLWNKKQLSVKSTEIAQLTQQKDWKKQLKRAMVLLAPHFFLALAFAPPPTRVNRSTSVGASFSGAEREGGSIRGGGQAGRGRLRSRLRRAR